MQHAGVFSWTTQLCLQVCEHTPELQPYKHRRLALTLDDKLTEVLQRLVQKALDSGSDALGDWSEDVIHAKKLDGGLALKLIQKLPFQLFPFKQSIQNVHLVQYSTAQETLNKMEYDPVELPLLPANLQNMFQPSERLHGQPLLQWSPFRALDYKGAFDLLRAAGAVGGYIRSAYAAFTNYPVARGVCTCDMNGILENL